MSAILGCGSDTITYVPSTSGSTISETFCGADGCPNSLSVQRGKWQASGGFYLDLSSVMSGQFQGDIGNSNIACSAGMNAIQQSGYVELILTAASPTSVPAANCSCPIGTNPGLCARQCARANTAAAQNASAQCAQLAGTYTLQVQNQFLHICSASLSSTCVDALLQSPAK
jgi:hypothetical protein